MCEKHKKSLDKVTNMLCDGGYTGKSFAQSIEEAIDCTVEIIKRSELHKFVVLPKRWIVERTFAWLENYRRLWKNCERTLENSRQSCLLAGVAFYQNAGLWNEPLLGWKITADFGRTVKEQLKIVDKVAYWQVWRFY
ncbi:hypothetical protein IKE_06227 [Bacillus cereus VD196]|uniref:Transposase DDE domain-containing protein n=1 Tax=Bacillus cereus VD196 TaxID=1053243 RepID=A0A9W5PXQ8_BACCE|nr:hypothetical protein IKE_06227 [Bacillus cereus VD196]